MKTKLHKWIIDRKFNMLLSLFFSFTLIFFAPLEIFFTIYEDVWFSFTHIIGLIAGAFLTALVLLFIFLTILQNKSEKWHGRVAAFLFAIVVAAYIQGNFLPSVFGTMNGETVDWSAFTWENVLSVSMWIIIVLLCMVLFHKKGQRRFESGSKIFMICILLVQIVTLGTLCVTTDGLKSKNGAAFLDKNVYCYSSNDNVVVLLLDMYDSKVFQEIYDEQKNNEYTEMLDGFTYYPDTLGAYSLTYCAIPHILTGEKYAQEDDMNEYINEAYKKSPLIEALWKNQYSINIYTNEAAPTEKDAYEKIDNYLPSEESDMHISSKKKMLIYIYKLVGIRYLPQPLKQYCWFYSEELMDLKEVNYEDDVYVFDNFMFYDRLENIEIETEKNTFHFYHLDGMHSPCYYDENFERTATAVSQEGREGTIRNGKGMLVLIKKFLAHLKEEGIYDNSAIIIMADHGGRFSDNEKETDIDRATPLLLVKGFGESHPLQVSSRAISYDDLQEAFLKLIDGKQGEDIFPEASMNKGRKRYFTDATTFREYYTTEHAFHTEAMRPVTEEN